jgi:AraC-like DNA-binding protein
MKYCISSPSEQLSRYVKHYWTIENIMPPGEKHVQRIVPNGMSELMFYLGDIPGSSDNRKDTSENSLITGQINEHYDLYVTRNLSLFSIVFQPFGLSMFFDIPAGELFNHNVPLKYILKDVVNKLESELYKAESFSERIKVVERFLTDRLIKVEKKYQLSRIEKSINLINKTKGIVSVDSLAAESCFSRKQFERVFMDQVGTSPKQFLRVIRFQNVIDQKARHNSLNLTKLSYKCGYYDQAHMSNDFQKLSGFTPRQYFSECDPYSDYFQ